MFLEGGGGSEAPGEWFHFLAPQASGEVPLQGTENIKAPCDNIRYKTATKGNSILL